MTMKVEEKTDAEFIDEWEDGLGWIGRPEEGMQRTSHAFVDDGVYLVDPLDADNLDEKIGGFGEVKGVIVLFNRHIRDSEKLAEKYGCPVYVPKWFDREIEAEVKKIEAKVPETSWELHEAVDSFTGREAALYNNESSTLIVADALGTTEMFKARGEEIGTNPGYRLNPPKKLLGLKPERIFCGHGKGIQEEASVKLENNLKNARRKTPSALFNAVRSLF